MGTRNEMLAGILMLAKCKGLARLKSLQILDVNGMQRVTDTCLNELAGLNSLQQLGLFNTGDGCRDEAARRADAWGRRCPAAAPMNRECPI